MKNTYYCIRCNFSTNRKSILNNHLNKKNKCKKNLHVYFIPNNILLEMSNLHINTITNDYQCKLCLNNFSCKYNLQRHIKNCKSKEKKNQSILVKLKILNYQDVKKYINDFYHLTILEYFEKNKIYNSFYKPWNINHIDMLTKKLLFITNDKYSDLLRKILDNDKNINIIYDKNEMYGYYINNQQNIEIINKHKIVQETMKKIINIYEIFKTNLIDYDKFVDINLLNREIDILEDKYNLFINNENIREKVENIILDIYSDKFIEIQNNALFELNNKNIGF